MSMTMRYLGDSWISEYAAGKPPKRNPNFSRILRSPPVACHSLLYLFSLPTNPLSIHIFLYTRLSS